MEGERRYTNAAKDRSANPVYVRNSLKKNSQPVISPADFPRPALANAE